jgi:8-oxo-dGTP pyrophosphatase MutT (NUDIX family)
MPRASFVQSFAANIQCANCGGHGHVYRICNHPISSFGIICYRMRHPGWAPEYLLVQRKDSLCYVEFIRGKYVLQNRGYIMKLLANMTVSEHERIGAGNFDDLWYGFWQTDHNRTFMKEYEQSKTRYNMLRDGYFLRPLECPTAEPILFNLASALASTVATHDETEWGFPKGRRNINESDIRCACREFQEETGLNLGGIHVLGNVKPFEEVFNGSNKVRYRHVYYLAHLKQRMLYSMMPVIDLAQQREIRKVGWFDYDGVQARIREENVERREVFKRVHQWVLQNELGNGRNPPEQLSGRHPTATPTP